MVSTATSSERLQALPVPVTCDRPQDASTFLPYGGDVKPEEAFKIIEEYKVKAEAVRATQVSIDICLGLVSLRLFLQYNRSQRLLSSGWSPRGKPEAAHGTQALGLSTTRFKLYSWFHACTCFHGVANNVEVEDMRTPRWYNSMVSSHAYFRRALLGCGRPGKIEPGPGVSSTTFTERFTPLMSRTLPDHTHRR